MSDEELDSSFCDLRSSPHELNISPSTRDPTESCSRTTKIGVLPRRFQGQGGYNQRFILPKGGLLPNTQPVISERRLIAETNQRKAGSTSDSKPCSYGLERKAQNHTITGEPICCICSLSREPKSACEVFDVRTEEGKNLADVIVYVLGSDAWDTLQQVSSHICSSCASLLQRIDQQRTQLDRDCSHLRDLYQSSQMDIDSDLYGENPSLSSFASSYNFNCRVLDISQGLVATAPDFSCPVIATHHLTMGHDGGPTATLYCSPLEWEEACEEVIPLDTLCGGCYMARGSDSKSLTLTVLSPRVLDDIMIELDQENPFLCGNCEKSFSKLYLLVSHIQRDHGSVEEKSYEKRDESNKAKSTISDAVDKRTGEVPSLQRPFQCEACDKCFSNYSNMMSHVEHYHGWSRQCNVGTCQKRLSSIAEFVTHHVQHHNTNFSIPENNAARNNLAITCPVCKKSSFGVNRHWEHSFIHDKVARFKCPVCDRRVNKVQNLKDHIKRHLGPESKTKKCEDCDKMFCPADIYKHRKTVHGKREVTYYCKICRKSVPLIHKLEHVNQT